MASSLFQELKRRNVFKVAAAYIIVSWLILQVVGSITPMLDLPDVFGRMVLVLLLIGLPIALLFAWAFELTPDGLKKESEVDRKNSITDQTSSKINLIIIIALVFIIGGMSIERFLLGDSTADIEQLTTNNMTEDSDSKKETPKPANTISKTSIAVLPFTNMSSDKDQEYFSDGISEEILNVLAKIPGLHITSRSSSFSFKGTNTDIPTIARKLGVANILEGSVRKSGTKVRITAQLIDAKTDKHLWSETYDRELTDIFKVQDEISAAIVVALRETLGIKIIKPEVISQVIDPEAYDWYLKGLQQYKKKSFTSLEASINSYKQALKIEPEFTMAKVNMALSVLQQNFTGSVADPTSIENVDNLIREVLEKEPDNSKAYLVKGLVGLIRNDLDATTLAVDKAYLLDPNNEEIIVRYVTTHKGEFSETKTTQLFDRALKIDPLNAEVPYFISRYYRGKYQTRDKAERYLKLAYKLNPQDTNYDFGLGELYGYSFGDLIKSIKQFKKSIREKFHDSKDPDAYIFLSRAYLSLGAGGKAEIYADLAVKTSQESADAAVSKIAAMILKGNNDAATKTLKNTLDNPQIFHRAVRKSKKYLALLGVNLYLKRKDYDTAKLIVEKIYPDAEQLKFAAIPPVNKQLKNRTAIVLLTTIYRAEGKLDAANQFASKLERFPRNQKASNVNSFNAFKDLTRAEILAAHQNHDGALKYLTKAIDEGYVLNWRTTILYNPIFSGLNKDPRFEALIKRLETEMIRQRKIIEEIDTNTIVKDTDQ